MYIATLVTLFKCYYTDIYLKIYVLACGYSTYDLIHTSYTRIREGFRGTAVFVGVRGALFERTAERPDPFGEARLTLILKYYLVSPSRSPPARFGDAPGARAGESAACAGLAGVSPRCSAMFAHTPCSDDLSFSRRALSLIPYEHNTPTPKKKKKKKWGVFWGGRYARTQRVHESGLLLQHDERHNNKKEEERTRGRDGDRTRACVRSILSGAEVQI